MLLKRISHNSLEYEFISTVVLFFRHATGYILTPPKNTVALLGKTVILECTTNLSTPVRWKVNSDIIYYNEVITESLRSRFRIENSSYGTHNLVIDKVDLSHAGTYICLPTVYPGEREEGFSAQLTVLGKSALTKVIMF